MHGETRMNKFVHTNLFILVSPCTVLVCLSDEKNGNQIPTAHVLVRHFLNSQAVFVKLVMKGFSQRYSIIKPRYEKTVAQLKYFPTLTSGYSVLKAVK